MTIPLISAKKINKTFLIKKKQLHALNEVDLTILQGETLGVVGESGCGKSTLGKVLLGLEKPSSGIAYFQNKDIHSLTALSMRHLRRDLQMIFQDPYSSFNPRMTAEEIVGEGLDIHQLAYGAARRDIIVNMLEQVGLEKTMVHRYPFEFSGGQRQRLGIARALVLNPQFIVCDEPLSALDACTQKQVIELLLKLKHERGLTYMFISHDMRAIAKISDRVAVMYLGRVVEHASAARLFTSPQHPYTQALHSAVPIPDPIREKNRERIVLKGEFPSPFDPPSGCPFHPRCPVAMPICRAQPPRLLEVNPGHFASCHLLQS